VLEGLNKSTKLRETIKASFDGLSIRDSTLKNSVLFFVPFYAVCYEVDLARRYLFIPPSTIGNGDFSAKLKGAFGMLKIRDHLTPRFKTMTALSYKVQGSQLNGLGQKNNLLNNSLFIENVEKGLVYLRGEGWLSDKEHQVLSNRLTVQR
jgi:hypothetical protein